MGTHISYSEYRSVLSDGQGIALLKLMEEQ